MTFRLSHYGIKTQKILCNPSPAKLYKEAITIEKGTTIASSGALVAFSFEKTGRCPKDKRIVEHPCSKDNIDWGDINIPFSQSSHDKVKRNAIDFFNTCQRLYTIDGYAGWDTGNRLKVRVITSRAYHALFMHNMLMRPTKEELKNFGKPDYIIYNAGETKADTAIEGVSSETVVSLSFEKRELVILGTEYAGEMKKGIFTVMNYLAPLKNQLSMHCSVTAEKGKSRCAILFGLSGTGKTTLSADPSRDLIGDDEHIWNEHGVSNIEGGCYAKVVDLSQEKEPDIFNAIKFGSVLENVYCDEDQVVDYSRTDMTRNTRGCYPIEAIPNARIPCLAGHPSDIIFLTCDAFGVLPPVSQLTPEQAMFHFISGYTAKIAGTEVGITEPEATFSACFGLPFMVWHPIKYAELLAEKMKKHHVNVWLVNTGWAGGAYGAGARIKLKYSRAIIHAINTGALVDAEKVMDPRFGFMVVKTCPDVPSEILEPRNAWENQAAYQNQANQLAGMFAENFKKYAQYADEGLLAATPKVIN